MTGTQNIHGPTGGLFTQVGRWLTLAIVSIAGVFMLFFAASFALFLVGALALLGLVAVSVFWIRAKLTGRPFGPRAQMEARMEEIRRQMGAAPGASASPFGGAFGAPVDDADGPVIDAELTPEGWTVER